MRVFGSIVGPDYLQHKPPRNSLRKYVEVVSMFKGRNIQVLPGNHEPKSRVIEIPHGKDYLLWTVQIM